MLPGRLHGASIKRVFPLLSGKKIRECAACDCKVFSVFPPFFLFEEKMGEEEEEDCKIEENEEEEEECFLQVSFSTSPLKSPFSLVAVRREDDVCSTYIYKMGWFEVGGRNLISRRRRSYVRGDTSLSPPFSTAREKK